MPDSIEPSIGRYGKGAKPVPLARINRVVVDPERRAKGLPVVGAAHKHHVGRASPGRHHAGQHVNVIVSRAAGAINRQEQLSIQSCWIDSPAADVATHVDGGASVTSWLLAPDLCIARALAKELADCLAADKQAPIGFSVQRSVYR